MRIRQLVNRLAWPFAGFFVGQGFQLSPLDKGWGAALVFWAFAMVCAGAGLLTWEPFLNPRGRKQRMAGLAVAIVLGAFIGSVALGAIYWVASKGLIVPALVASAESENLLKNGGFEEGARYWGTGYIEAGLAGAKPPGFPYLAFNGAKSSGRVDPAEHRTNDGLASYRIEHTSREQANVYGTLSQRLDGLKPHTFYLVTFWVKSDHAEPGSVFLTADTPWAQTTQIKPGPQDWYSLKHLFNTENSEAADIRFVVKAPALIWLDDISVREATPVAAPRR